MASGGRYCVDVSTVEDNIAEGTEQFQLSFASVNPAGFAVFGDPEVVCVDISDTDGKAFDNNIIEEGREYRM